MTTLEEIADRGRRSHSYGPSEVFAYLLGYLDSLNASLATDAELAQFHPESRGAYLMGVTDSASKEAMSWQPANTAAV